MKKPMTGTDKSHATQFEFSAGGVAQEGDRLLMVRVKNLEGNELWTFPKGHVEPGESAEQAAVREVLEETGHRCEITAPLEDVRYWFQRDGILTRKTVRWYLMRSLGQEGTPDPEEVLEAAWVPFAEVGARVRYKSDKKIYSLVKKGIEG